MLVNMMQNDSLIYAIGVFGMVGILSKMVVSLTLNRLVKSASNMSKSNHKFMKLVKAKFEHASMANNGVENVPIFVDKYIHEYKTLGMTVHSWQKIQRISLGIVIVSGLVGGSLGWYLGFGNTTVFQYAFVTVGTTIILLTIYQVVDENHRVYGLRVYMVDYLENVLASRYEKAKAKNLRGNNTQRTENYPVESKEIDDMDSTKELPEIKGAKNVDNFSRNREFSTGHVDNFDTSVIPSLEINALIKEETAPSSGEDKEEKIILTNNGFGWQADESHETAHNLKKEVAEGLITEASYTGVTREEAKEILESRIEAVRTVQESNDYEVNKHQIKNPKFHIQTLEEENHGPRLTAIEQMLQEEAQKRTVAKEQAGTSNTVNAAMIREILEEFMA